MPRSPIYLTRDVFLSFLPTVPLSDLVSWLCSVPIATFTCDPLRISWFPSVGITWRQLRTWSLRLEGILMQFRKAVCHYFLFEMDTLAVRTGVYWPCHVGNMWEKDQSHLKSINGHLAATLQTQQYSRRVHPWEKKLTFKDSFKP